MASAASTDSDAAGLQLHPAASSSPPASSSSDSSGSHGADSGACASSSSSSLDSDCPQTETMDDDDFLASLEAYERRGNRSRHSVSEPYIPPPLALKMALAAGAPLPPVEPPLSPEQRAKEGWEKSVGEYKDMKASAGKWRPAKKVWAVTEECVSPVHADARDTPLPVSPAEDIAAAATTAAASSDPSWFPLSPRSPPPVEDPSVTPEIEEAAWMETRIRLGDALTEPRSELSGFAPLNLRGPAAAATPINNAGNNNNMGGRQRGSVDGDSRQAASASSSSSSAAASSSAGGRDDSIPDSMTLSADEYESMMASSPVKHPRHSQAEHLQLLRAYLADLSAAFYQQSSRGTKLVKHSKYGFPKVKLVKLNWETGVLSWGSGEIRIKEIVSMKLHRFSGSILPSNAATNSIAAAAALAKSLSPAKSSIGGGAGAAGSPVNNNSGGQDNVTVGGPNAFSSPSASPVGSPTSATFPASPKSFKPSSTHVAISSSPPPDTPKGHFLFTIHTPSRALQLDAPTAFDRELWLLGLYNFHKSFVVDAAASGKGGPLAFIGGQKPTPVQTINFEIQPTGEMKVRLLKQAPNSHHPPPSHPSPPASPPLGSTASSNHSIASIPHHSLQLGAGGAHSPASASSAPSSSTPSSASSSVASAPSTPSSSPATSSSAAGSAAPTAAALPASVIIAPRLGALGHSGSGGDINGDDPGFSLSSKTLFNKAWWHPSLSAPPAAALATAAASGSAATPAAAAAPIGPSASFLFHVSSGRASLIKHSRSGKPKLCSLRISKTGLVSWKGKETLLLSEAQEVAGGCFTPVFQKSIKALKKKAPLQAHCFSIVMPTRTLDLEVTISEEQKKNAALKEKRRSATGTLGSPSAAQPSGDVEEESEEKQLEMERDAWVLNLKRWVELLKREQQQQQSEDLDANPARAAGLSLNTPLPSLTTASPSSSPAPTATPPPATPPAATPPAAAVAAAAIATAAIAAATASQTPTPAAPAATPAPVTAAAAPAATTTPAATGATATATPAPSPVVSTVAPVPFVTTPRKAGAVVIHTDAGSFMLRPNPKLSSPHASSGSAATSPAQPQPQPQPASPNPKQQQQQPSPSPQSSPQSSLPSSPVFSPSPVSSSVPSSPSATRGASTASNNTILAPVPIVAVPFEIERGWRRSHMPRRATDTSSDEDASGSSEEAGEDDDNDDSDDDSPSDDEDSTNGTQSEPSHSSKSHSHSKSAVRAAKEEKEKRIAEETRRRLEQQAAAATAAAASAAAAAAKDTAKDTLSEEKKTAAADAKRAHVEEDVDGDSDEEQLDESKWEQWEDPAAAAAAAANGDEVSQLTHQPSGSEPSGEDSALASLLRMEPVSAVHVPKTAQQLISGSTAAIVLQLQQRDDQIRELQATVQRLTAQNLQLQQQLEAHKLDKMLADQQNIPQRDRRRRG